MLYPSRPGVEAVMAEEHILGSFKDSRLQEAAEKFLEFTGEPRNNRRNQKRCGVQTRSFLESWTER